MKVSEKTKILIFDIETPLLKAYIWDCGDQVVRHDQLVPGWDQFNIICIAYKWSHEKKIHVLHWDYDSQDSSGMIEEFDKIVEQADIIVGKNSNKFDIKMVNGVRFLKGLKPFPQWAASKSDIEVQCRKHFRFPSQSLEYLAKNLGMGGKDKMERQDWINIQEKTADGPKAFKKMLRYCVRDVKLTDELLKRLDEYIISDLNSNDFSRDGLVCRLITCGSSDIIKNGTRIVKRRLMQRYHCNTHNGYAGLGAVNKDGNVTRIM